ncbi:Ni/Fe hydrogenase [Chitinilyticum piscinae]|uniref:Ni/Fe hydrogenase n=1 Tax=Chitinilyticum piscinae TaxID=2866724 RepID=A0A8J7FGL6_9NEIS|nr:Ni/Fe hydrogenase [Chitinilyticum piscinae]MBE9608770.1 Ni/Fe hydrogenase [Chitinilyticum piscinae]
MTAPILFFGYGNPARGDDALGPLLAARLADWLGKQGLQEQVEVLEDFQLSPEHACDLYDRHLLILADASLRISEPCRCSLLAPVAPACWASHAATPAELLWYADTLLGIRIPHAILIELQGNTFELGSGLSQAGKQALEAGWLAACELISKELQLCRTSCSC